MTGTQGTLLLAPALLLGLCSCQQQGSAGPKSAATPPEAVSSVQEERPMSDPYAGATAISKDGVIILYLRGDEIVEDGSVVGKFDGNQALAQPMSVEEKLE